MLEDEATSPTPRSYRPANRRAESGVGAVKVFARVGFTQVGSKTSSADGVRRDVVVRTGNSLGGTACSFRRRIRLARRSQTCRLRWDGSTRCQRCAVWWRWRAFSSSASAS